MSVYHYSHVPDEETEAQRSYFPKSHHCQVGEQGLQMSSSDSQSNARSTTLWLQITGNNIKGRVSLEKARSRARVSNARARPGQRGTEWTLEVYFKMWNDGSSVMAGR